MNRFVALFFVVSSAASAAETFDPTLLFYSASSGRLLLIEATDAGRAGLFEADDFSSGLADRKSGCSWDRRKPCVLCHTQAH